MVNPNFTQVFGNADLVHYNVSYQIANQPPLMITPNVWMAIIGLGVGCLILSALTKEETCNDLSGILASLFLFVGMLTSFAVDTVTSGGVVSQCLTMVGNNCTQMESILLENHIIYHYDLVGVVLGALFVLSLANLYRLWLDYKRITGQKGFESQSEPSIGRRDNNMKPQHDDDYEKEK